MMSLDDVIKAMENCYGPDAECCAKCQYPRDVAGTGTICLKCNLEDDALHYLKEYQKILPVVPSLINTAIAVQKKGKTIG